MKLIHLYSGDDGQSHFIDRQIALIPSNLGGTSAVLPAESVFVRDTADGPQHSDFHPAPRRQLVFLIRGRVEYECGDGSKRELGAGDVLFADDLTGQGHRACVLEAPRLQIFVPVPEDVDIASWAPKELLRHDDDGE
jgi:quercetin dioxygenase-like cupin family protein